MKQVLSKKFLWLIPLCISLVLTGCFQKTDENVSRDDEAVSGVQIAQPEGPKVTQFAVKDEFEITSNLMSSNDVLEPNENIDCY